MSVRDWIELTLRILLTLGFGAGAIVFFWRFYHAMSAGEELRVDYHWGGLGGGLGGWRLSKAFGYLFAAFALGGLLAVTVIGLRPETTNTQQAANSAKQSAAADSTKTDAAAPASKGTDSSATESKSGQPSDPSKTGDPTKTEDKTGNQKKADDKSAKP
jgi:predicted lipid-binding transport protein (Tim44 family)